MISSCGHFLLLSGRLSCASGQLSPSYPARYLEPSQLDNPRIENPLVLVPSLSNSLTNSVRLS